MIIKGLLGRLVRNPLLRTGSFSMGFGIIFTVCILGCAVTSKDIVYHSFKYPSPVRQETSSIPETLMVYQFLLDRSVDTYSLVIAESSGNEKFLQLHRWEENPADMMTELVLRDLRSSGLFERTVDQQSNVRYRYALEGNIRTLQGVIKDGKGSAVIVVDVILTDFEARPGAQKTLLKKTYNMNIPSNGTDPDSIIKSLNIGIKDFSDGLRNDLRILLRKSDSPSEIYKSGTRKIAAYFSE